jgi:glycosyltransferase involved in cell wall biosynthesis
VNNAVHDIFYNATGDEFVNKYKLENFVLFTGNIIPRKNPLLLAKVLNKLQLNGVFIGSGDYGGSSYLESFKREIYISNGRLIWINGLGSEDPMLASAYHAARVFCLPSRSETQPQSALEALVAKKPIILANKPYAYQSPFEGVFKSNLCEKDLAEAVIFSMSAKVEYSNLESLRWKNVASKIGDIYKTVL